MQTIEDQSTAESVDSLIAAGRLFRSEMEKLPEWQDDREAVFVTDPGSGEIFIVAKGETAQRLCDDLSGSDKYVSYWEETTIETGEKS